MTRIDKDLQEFERLLNPPRNRFVRCMSNAICRFGDGFSRPNDDPIDRILAAQAGFMVTGILVVAVVAHIFPLI